MPHPRLDGVVGSWHLYALVEEAIKRREIPAARTSRVDWKEGGVISPRREYRTGRGNSWLKLPSLIRVGCCGKGRLLRG
jgi:hypothetical protein